MGLPGLGTAWHGTVDLLTINAILGSISRLRLYINVHRTTRQDRRGYVYIHGMKAVTHSIEYHLGSWVC